jgi:hypothetical protein
MNSHKVGCNYIFLKVKVSFYSVDVATINSIITIDMNTIGTECNYSECRCEACQGAIRFWGRIQNTSFSSELMNGSNKLESLSLASLSSLARYTVLADWAHSYVTKKMKCFEYGLCILPLDLVTLVCAIWGTRSSRRIIIRLNVIPDIEVGRQNPLK